MLLRRLLALVTMFLFLSMMVILVWRVYEHHRNTSPPDDPITAELILPAI
jgi:hypothetical protein